MNKLRKKIFWTLFIILSIFLISVLTIFNYQSYHREKTNIEQNLFRLNNQNKKADMENNLHKPDDMPEEQNNPKRFIDATIYTVLLGQDNNILNIISHTEDGLISDNIKEIALDIISENEKDKTYIGNLYFSNYAYKYEENNYIILIDNTTSKEKLTSLLEISILLFLLMEIIVILISRLLSNWIIKPVEASFNKQKQFIADASHELKTPLSVIMACAETLENNPNEKKWIYNIKSEAERMNKLIKSLLDLAKLENEKKEFDEINLSKLIEKSVLSLESLAYEKNLKLDYKITDDINFKCNSEEMKQLISILLDNAIKHCAKKGKITINLKCEKNNIILEVINQGKPIPKGEEEKIFERFYRVDKSRNRNDNRYGLGLAIAKGIASNHNGKIEASSANDFTTFKVFFKIRTLN